YARNIKVIIYLTFCQVYYYQYKSQNLAQFPVESVTLDLEGNKKSAALKPRFSCFCGVFAASESRAQSRAKAERTKPRDLIVLCFGALCPKNLFSMNPATQPNSATGNADNWPNSPLCAKPQAWVCLSRNLGAKVRDSI